MAKKKESDIIVIEKEPIVIDHTARKHAICPPSAMERIAACPGSVIYNDRKQAPSPWAREGTIAHECLERGLTNLKMSYDEIFQHVKDEFPDMREHIAPCIQYVLDLKRKYGAGRFEVETRVEFSEYSWGTLDTGIMYRVIDKQNVIVFDLKYGQGISVQAKDNLQLLTYALGLIKKWGLKRYKKVCLIIYQPRIIGEQTERIAWYTRKEMDVWKKKIFKIVKKASDVYNGIHEPRFYAGDHCRFCPGKDPDPDNDGSICPAYKKLVDKGQGGGGLILIEKKLTRGVPSPETLTDRNVAKLLQNRGNIEAFLKSVAAYAKARHAQGKPIPGTKSVSTRRQRKWLGTVAECGEILKELKVKDPFREVLKTIGSVELEIADRLIKRAVKRGKELTKGAAKEKAAKKLQVCTQLTPANSYIVHESDSRPATDNQLDSKKLLTEIKHNKD